MTRLGRCTVAALAIALGCASAPAQLPPAGEKTGAIAERLDQSLDRWGRDQTSTTIAGVIRGSEIVWQGTRSPAGSDRPTPATLFRIGSLTKIFVGLEVLQLQEKKLLDLDEPIDAYLPEAKSIRYPTTDSARVTLRHMLVHSSGLPAMAPGEITDGAALVRSLAGVRLLFSPGTDELYSNFAYAVIGEIINRRLGTEYQVALRDSLLLPLNMRSTRFQRGGDDGGKPVPWKGLGPMDSAGGLVSSFEDLARFVTFELSAWPPRDGSDDAPVSRHLVRQTQLPFGAQPAGTQMYGVGWIVASLHGRQIATLTGKIEGYAATITLMPGDGLGAVVLDSRSTRDTQQLTFDLLDEVMASQSLGSDKAHPQLNEAIETIVAVVNGRPVAAVSDRFQPDFFEKVPQFDAVVSRVRARLGTCGGVESMHARSASAAQAVVRCEKGRLSISVELSGAASDRIGRLLLQ